MLVCVSVWILNGSVCIDMDVRACVCVMRLADGALDSELVRGDIEMMSLSPLPVFP